MVRNQLRASMWVSVGCTSLVLLLVGASPAIAQNAQAEAAAEVAKARSPADVAPLTTPAVPLNPATDRNESDTKSPAANAEALKRRAGERIGQDPRGRALILGMHLQEGPQGHVKVVEVAAASPAFDAGIKQGDELVSFAGFHADSYRKWIDGMSRLATDAEDNSRLPVVVMRDGEQVDAQIRIPESHLGAVELPIGAPLTQFPPTAPGVVTTGIQGVPVQGGGTDVAIDNIGPLGDFFGREASPAGEKAMAEIFRVGGAPFTAPGGTSANRPGATPSDRGARIGIAGFRNSPDGMLVMVDVGGLAPGNYLVGISDPGFVGAGTAPGAAPRVQPPPGTPAPPIPPRSFPTPNGAQRQDATPNPAGTIPANPTGDAIQPQSNRQPAALPQIPVTVLAQVTDNTQPTSGASGTTIPPTGQATSSTVPPTGQVDPSDTTPTGQSKVNNALLEQARQARQANEARRRAGVTGGQMLNQIGTLTVDQSGTGRVQTVVEALQVQDVVGQAIVLYSQPAEQQNTLPPNLDPTVDPSGGSAVIDPARPATGQSAAGQTAVGGASPPTPTAPNPAVGGLGLNSPKPVAAGIIRLLPDRRPPAVNDRAPDGVFGTPPVQQPANNTPPVGTNPIR